MLLEISCGFMWIFKCTLFWYWDITSDTFGSSKKAAGNRMTYQGCLYQQSKGAECGMDHCGPSYWAFDFVIFYWAFCSMCIYLCIIMYIYIYTHAYVYITHIYIYIYIHIYIPSYIIYWGSGQLAVFRLIVQFKNFTTSQQNPQACYWQKGLGRLRASSDTAAVDYVKFKAGDLCPQKGLLRHTCDFRLDFLVFNGKPPKHFLAAELLEGQCPVARFFFLIIVNVIGQGFQTCW